MKPFMLEIRARRREIRLIDYNGTDIVGFGPRIHGGFAHDATTVSNMLPDPSHPTIGLDTTGCTYAPPPSFVPLNVMPEASDGDPIVLTDLLDPPTAP